MEEDIAEVTAAASEAVREAAVRVAEASVVRGPEDSEDPDAVRAASAVRDPEDSDPDGAHRPREARDGARRHRRDVISGVFGDLGVRADITITAARDASDAFCP